MCVRIITLDKIRHTAQAVKQRVFEEEDVCFFDPSFYFFFTQVAEVPIKSTYICRKKYGTGHVTLATSLPGLPVAVDSESYLQSSQIMTPRCRDHHDCENKW